MKILNIWFNHPIPQKYQRSIDTQRKYFAGYEYEMIDKIQSVRLLTQANDLYDGVNTVDEYINMPIPGSDYLRMYLLSLYPDCLYIDCDVEIIAPPPEFGAAPAIEHIRHTDFFNNGIMYNADRCDLFGAFCKYWFGQKQLHYLYASVNKFGHDNQCDKLSPEWYNHYMYTAKG